MYKLYVIMMILVASHATWANNAQLENDKYFQISSVEVELIEQGAWEPEVLQFDLSQYQLAEELSPQDIINFGQKIWSIIKENEPVLNFKTKKANAIPRAAKEPFQLANWSAPISNTYKMAFKNGFGSEVVTFIYKVIFTGNGSYEGRGQYLANVSVHPVQIDVSWGFDFNAEVEIGDILNMATIDDPMAGMQVNVNWGVETMVKKIKGGDFFFVQGDGALVVL